MLIFKVQCVYKKWITYSLPLYGWVNFPRKSWISFNYKSTKVRGAKWIDYEGKQIFDVVI